MTLAVLTDWLNLNKLMGILPNHSEHGKEIDHMLNFCHWFMLALFIGWSTYYVYTLWRFRASKNPKANYHGVTSHVSTHLEASVVIIEAVILLGFAIPLWGKRVNEIPTDEKNPLRIRAIGYQFGWFFHYAGQDGKFGAQHPRFVGDGNNLGIDPNDPNASDDVVVTSNMHIENQRPTVVRVSSRDVIHGFCLPQMRVQQDATPGLEAPMWFRPITVGAWDIICAQLCGAGHYAMRADYTVEDKKDFDGWFKDQQDATQKIFSAQREILKKKASEAPAPHGAEHTPAH